MKKLILLLIVLCTMFSCDKQEINGYKNEVAIELVGKWNIYNNDVNEGTITFSRNETFVINSTKGDALGDYSVMSTGKNYIVITYAEGYEGEEILSDKDYDNGGIGCKITPISNDNYLMRNLPYYRNKTIKISKN